MNSSWNHSSIDEICLNFLNVYLNQNQRISTVLLKTDLNLILLPNEMSKATPMNLPVGKKGEANKK